MKTIMKPACNHIKDDLDRSELVASAFVLYIGNVTPIIIYFHHTHNYLWDQGIPETFHTLLKTKALLVVQLSVVSAA